MLPILVWKPMSTERRSFAFRNLLLLTLLLKSI